MEKKVKKYIRENANRIWKDNEDKTFHYPKVKEEYLAITKKELQRFAEIMVEDVEKLFSQELDKAREEGYQDCLDDIWEEAKGLRGWTEHDGSISATDIEAGLQEAYLNIESKLKDNK